MFKSKRLRGGHRVGLQKTQNVSPAVQNTYNSQPASAPDENSWDWGSSNAQFQGSSIHDNQNSTVDPRGPSHIGFQNQQNFHTNYQYMQPAPSEPNVESNSSFNGGIEQNNTAGWSSQGNDEWTWEENKWDNWEPGGGLQPNQQSIPQPLSDNQQQLLTPQTMQQNQPAHENLFEKVDAAKYRENIKNEHKYRTDGNDNSNNYQAYSNENAYNSESNHGFNSNKIQEIASMSEDYDMAQSNQQHHPVYSNYDKIDPHQTSLIDKNTNQNINSEWNWDSDNWGPEQAVDTSSSHQNTAQLYQPSSVSETQSRLDDLMSQDTKLVTENVSDTVPNSVYEKQPEFSNEGIVSNINYPAESSSPWDNDNWSGNGFSSDSVAIPDENVIEQHHLSQDDSDKSKATNNLNVISAVELSQDKAEIPAEHISNENFYQERETGEIAPVDNMNMRPAEWSYNKLAIVSDAVKSQNQCSEGDEKSSILPSNSMDYTSVTEALPQTVSFSSDMYNPEESNWQNFVMPGVELDSQSPNGSPVSQADELFDKDSNANLESIEDNNFYENENIKSLSLDEGNLIPAVKPKLREEILSEYKAAISRSRTTSLTDSIKESNIAILDEELQGIFSSPTDLVNYPSVDEIRNRTSSFTRLSFSRSEISVHSEPELQSPLQCESNFEEIDYETNEAPMPPTLTEIESSSQNFSNYNTAASPINTFCSEVAMEMNTGPTETVNEPRFHQSHIPAAQESLHSPAIAILPSLNHRKDSPFQPPEPKNFHILKNPLYEKFERTDNQFTPDDLAEPAIPISEANGENYHLSNLLVNVDCSPRRETLPDKNVLPSVPSGGGGGGATAINTFTDEPPHPTGLELYKDRIVKTERNSPREEKFTRMIPGESSKGKRGPSIHPAPPAMPTGRVVTGNDHPQPLASARIKQEPNEVRSPPDGPDTLSPINHDASVIPPVRSETIGSEEPSGVVASRKDKKTDSNRDRGRDYDSSSGEYYADRYHPDSRRQNAYYYREGSPNGHPSYEREYDSKYHRRPRYNSDEEDDDRDSRFDQRSRRHRSYRDDQPNYVPNVKQEPGYRRKRDHPSEKQRGYRQSTADEDAFYPKSDRSRPSSRSSSPNNHERALSKHSNARYRDKQYEKQQRRPSHRDYHPDNSFDKGNSREQYYRGYANQYPDQYGSRAMYDQSYYYHYYQKYMEQHPYYRDYYRQYYARNYGYPPNSEVFPDDKASIRSGRSSVNEELKKSMSSLAVHDPYEYMYGQPPQSPYHHSQYRQDYYEGSTYGGYAPSSIYPDDTTSQSNFYRGGDVSGVPSVAEEIATDKQHRLTPHQFGAPHFISRFTPGGKLIVVLPNDPKDDEQAIVEVHDLQELLAVDPDYSRRIEQMENYEGPIVYNDTHKDVVIRFCAYKIAEATADTSLDDQQSVILLWEYLSLLVKQNGKASGGDLASLLLERKNKSESPVPKGSLEENTTTPSGTEDDTSSSVSDARPFTEFLCLGRRKEAVDYAIRHGLWGHAMMLASKMDSITHTKVMTAFLRSIPTSDVLQTAVQHMSGKKPDVAKNFNPERWGDWREHLAVLVSNSTGNAQRDNASIISLGDSLAARGQLHAAHICYVAGEAEWGTFIDKSSKIVLIGSSHDQSLQTFVTEDAFQCTEVYEYAKSLDGTSEVFHTFQSYKLIYAQRLVECGFAADALRYCEVVSSVVCQSPQYYQEDFVAQVWELASRLKFYDAHYQMGGEITEMPDPEWLQNLSAVLYSMQMEIADPSNAALLDDSPVADGAIQPFAKVEAELAAGQDVNDNLNAASPQVEGVVTPQHSAYPQPASQPMMQTPSQTIPHDSRYPQHTPSHKENNMPPTSYPEMGMPIATVPPYGTIPESVPSYQHTSPVQRQEPSPQQWQPSADVTPVHLQPESPPMNTQQRRSSEEEEYWASMGNKPAASQSKATVELTEKKSNAKDIDTGKDGEERSGFFGSLFGGWKKSNQAKLPDDSNPTIIWDETKKKWVNTDGEEETEGPPPPPPTNMTAPPMMTASFRGGARVSRYVDPVGDKRRASGPTSLPSIGSLPLAPSGAAGITPNGTLPTMSPVATPSTFLPPGQHANLMQGSPVIEPDLHAAQLDSNRQAADGFSVASPVPMMGAPPMFNPNQFGATAVPSSGSLPRKSGPARRAFGQR